MRSASASCSKSGQIKVGRRKAYLLREGLMSFWDSRELSGKPFNVLGKQVMYWCCDPDCDRVIVGVPLLMFLDEGRAGAIALHWACAEALMAAGVFALSR